MNITQQNIDSVNATITIAMNKEDYQPEVEKALNDIRKGVVIDGFRKGNAPKSRIQATYGRSVMIEKINHLVADKLYEYLQENKLEVLGEPLPNKKGQEALDFDNQEDFQFVFDIALAPKIDVKFTKDDKLPYYIIAVPDDVIERQIESYRTNYGKHVPADSVEAKDIVKGVLVEQGGNITSDLAILMPSYLKNEPERAKFIGAKADDVITFNPYTAYEGNEVEVAAFLKIKKEEVSAHQGNFTFTIGEITRYREAELGQELYDTLYEPGTVTSIDGLKAKIREAHVKQLAPESDHRFVIDVKKALEDKMKNVQFPDKFLKRWLVVTNSKYTQESVEEEYPKFINDLRFHFIKEQIIKENDLKVTTEDVEQIAFATVRSQLAKYGMGNMPDSLLVDYVQKMLDKEENTHSLFNQAMETKVIDVLKAQVALQLQEVTLEEFKELFETQNKDK
jgi:trigger factor